MFIYCVTVCIFDCLFGIFLQTWEKNNLFADSDEATLFLGVLDTIFLFSYAVVSVRASWGHGGGAYL